MRYAIVHRESGMLMGLGRSERAAWADAERDARAGHVAFCRDEHECRDAARGSRWEADTRGGIVTARLVRPAHRPRRDPGAARIVRSYSLHPDTIARITAEAQRRGESAGQVVDRLAHALPSE